MYPFLESICVENGKAQHLDFHQERLERTFKQAYAKSAPYSLQDVIRLPDDMPAYKIKLRFLFNEHSYSYEFKKYKTRNIKTLQVVENNNIDYSLKRTDRHDIDDLLAQKYERDDILIVKNGFVTDSSTANIVFWDGKEWLTPDTPLLKGTCRERLLQEGTIKEATIRTEDISKFESFCLINAMLEGFDNPLPISSIIGM